MNRLLLVVLLAPAIARAQAPGADGSPSAASIQLTLDARAAAHEGHCQTIAAIGQRVQQIDPAYYLNVFAVDPELAACAAPRADIPDGDYKDPTTALVLSLGITVGGYGLIAVAAANSSSSSNNGLLITGGIAAALGPTLGHWYAGSTWNGGLGMRLAGSGLAIVGLFTAVSSSCWFGDSENCNNPSGKDIGATMAVGGALLYAAGTIYEIATAPDAARDYNRSHHLMDAQLTFAPVQARTGTAPGVALVGRF